MPGTTPAIILIHGLGLKEGEEQEFRKWKEALNRHLGDDQRFATAELRMAYYSEELHPEVHVVRAATGSGSQRRGPRGQVGTALPAATAIVEENVVDVLEQNFWDYAAQQERTQITEDAAAGVAPAEEAGGSVRRRRGRPTRRAATQLPDVEIAPGQTYRAFVRDVIKYFGLGHREPVNAKLAAELDAVAGRPTLLVSHSLGTIVSYDVLAAGNHRIDCWITLGSPLGYAQEVQGKLRTWLENLEPEEAVRLANVGAHVEETVAWVKDTADAARKQIDGFFSGLRRRGGASRRRGAYMLPAPQFPDGKVDNWFNIFDPADPVASPPYIGDPTLADEYLSGGRERVFDITITNAGGHPHSEVGYLEAHQTTWIVKDFLLRHAPV